MHNAEWLTKIILHFAFIILHYLHQKGGNDYV